MLGIKIPIGTDNTGLGTGLSQAKGQLKGFQTTALAVFGALGGYKALSELNEIRHEIDRIGKLASQTGLGARFLQQMSRDAETAGVDLEALAKGWARFNRELQLGMTAGGQDALDVLGINPSDLDFRDPQKSIEGLAAAFNRLTDAEEKNAVAMQLFGQRGIGLLNLFESMAGGMSEMDTLSDQQVRNIEAMNDSWTRLKQSVAAAGAEVLAFFSDTKEGRQKGTVADMLIERGVPARKAFDIAQDFSSDEPERRRALPTMALREAENRRVLVDQQKFVNEAFEEYQKQTEEEEQKEEARREKDAAAEEAKKQSKIEEIQFETSLLKIADEKLRREKERARLVEERAQAEEGSIAAAELDRDIARLDAATDKEDRKALQDEKKSLEEDLQKVRDERADREEFIAQGGGISVDALQSIGGGGGVYTPDSKIQENLARESVELEKQILEAIRELNIGDPLAWEDS